MGSKKLNITVLLLFAATFLIGEIKYLLPLSTSTNPVNWFLISGKPQPPIWYYHTWAKAINWIIVMYAFMLATTHSSKHIKWAVKCYFIYRILDLVMYIACGSVQEYYWIIYPSITLIAILTYKNNLK